MFFFVCFFSTVFSNPILINIQSANLKSDHWILESSTSLINKPRNVKSSVAQTVQNE